MAFREPHRSPLGAYIRSPLHARTRIGGLPVNGPQYMPGFLSFTNQVVNSPHGMPNCNPGDPQSPETATLLSSNVGQGYTGGQYMVGFDNPSLSQAVVDLSRTVTLEADFGVAVTLGAACIAYGPIVRKSDLPGPVPAGNTLGSLRMALTAGSIGPWNMQYGNDADRPDWLYLVGSLTTTGEAPQSLTWSAPAAAVTGTGTLIGYLRCATIHSPEMLLTGVTGPGVEAYGHVDASFRYAWAVRYLDATLPTPGQVTSATINAFGYGSPHTDGGAKVYETATLTINWT